MLKDLLQGKPFRHPLHPFLVHFPVGFFVLSLILDLASLAFRSAPQLVSGAFYAMLVGIATALLAAIPGFIDYSDIRADHPAKRIALSHMILNLLAVGLYAVNLGLRSTTPEQPQTPMTPLILSLIGIGLFSVSGYLGGKLVYDHGIAVGRHRRHTATPETTLHFSTAKVKPEGNTGLVFVEVAEAARLEDQTTLRLEIDGQVIALAKSSGTFYAVQEFCTHRFGPLSEGVIKDGQVQCPWHGSCFDLRTGKVTQGPAKENLQSFPVEVRQGKVCVGLRPKIVPSQAGPPAAEPRREAA